MSFEILIIDDNSDIRFILNELISEAGYKTRVAANYNQALTEIDKKLPDVAIIDVKLDKGDNDGIELLNHIKNKNKEISDEKILELAIDAGADECFSTTADHTIYCQKDEIYNVKNLLEKNINNFLSTEIQWIPHRNVDVPKEQKEDIVNFLETLEDDDDVQNVYSNIKI